jgi:hypothetical protein
MKIQRVAVLALPVAAAAFLVVTTLPAFAVDAKVAALSDGRVHGFEGCLTQESTDPPYFDLLKAKSDDGADLGTVRLIGDFTDMNPKASLNKRVKVTGVYLVRQPTESDPGSGHIEMKDARVVAGKCP